MDGNLSTRVLVCGGAVGLVVNMGEFLLNGVLLHGEWGVVMQSLGRPPPGVESIASLTVMTFLLGVATMWLYVILRRGCETDREAALRAALVSWLFAYGLGFGWSWALGVFPVSIYLPTLVWSGLELLLGTLVGARLYAWRRPVLGGGLG